MLELAKLAHKIARIGSLAARVAAITLSIYALIEVGQVTGAGLPEHVGNADRALAAGGSALALFAWGRSGSSATTTLRSGASVAAAVLLGLVCLDETLHIVGGNLVRGDDALNLAALACLAAAACGLVALRERVPSRATAWALTIGGAWAALFFLDIWLPDGEGRGQALAEAVAFVPGVVTLIRLGSELRE